MSDKIPVVEIFGPTVQGEGPNVGARCIFVRVKGCSFKCSWCDSKFTWNDHDSDVVSYEPTTLADLIVQKCLDTKCRKVILTGGNPCLYNFTYVLKKFKAFEISTDVETQGDLYPDWLDSIDTLVFSPKAPSSGMPDTYDKITEYIKTQISFPRKIAIKIPIFNTEDIEFSRKYAEFVNSISDKNKRSIDLRLYLSVGNSDVTTTASIRDRVLSDYESLLNRINEFPNHFQDVYILPQLHTLVWGNKQGV